MKRTLGDRLTYANVMSTLCFFMLVGGGAAYAASHLGKNSVGAKQLKSNAVTTAKIKKSAVTKAKIKAGAVDSSKIADGSVAGADLNATSAPFSQIVHEARGSSVVQLPTNIKTTYPVSNASYTQEAGRDDTYFGGLDVTIPPSCAGNRTVYGYLLVDSADPNKAFSQEVVATGEFHDSGTGQVSGRVNLGPYANGVRFQPASATNHTLTIAATASCSSGGGVTATFGGVDVIGTK